MTRKDVLAAAEKCVCGDLEQDYGTPEDSFDTIARMWAAYLRALRKDDRGYITIMPKDVAAMLALLKIARIATGHSKDDNWIDLAGYAACGGEIESAKKPAQ
ncbi:MAG: DUF6378 domain-containing protein [Clostridiales bacterium]|nr:DUF6378 domain-containing protein [Clostridiales bacterium]MDY4181004.1 DUF6378 domain-containing protein [Pseudoflavonifractor sp.]